MNLHCVWSDEDLGQGNRGHWAWVLKTDPFPKFPLQPTVAEEYREEEPQDLEEDMEEQPEDLEEDMEEQPEDLQDSHCRGLYVDQVVDFTDRTVCEQDHDPHGEGAKGSDVESVEDFTEEEVTEAPLNDSNSDAADNRRRDDAEDNRQRDFAANSQRDHTSNKPPPQEVAKKRKEQATEARGHQRDDAAANRQRDNSTANRQRDFAVNSQRNHTSNKPNSKDTEGKKKPPPQEETRNRKERATEARGRQRDDAAANGQRDFAVNSQSSHTSNKPNSKDTKGKKKLPPQEAARKRKEPPIDALDARGRQRVDAAANRQRSHTSNKPNSTDAKGKKKQEAARKRKEDPTEARGRNSQHQDTNDFPLRDRASVRFSWTMPQTVPRVLPSRTSVEESLREYGVSGRHVNPVTGNTFVVDAMQTLKVILKILECQFPPTLMALKGPADLNFNPTNTLSSFRVGGITLALTAPAANSGYYDTFFRYQTMSDLIKHLTEASREGFQEKKGQRNQCQERPRERLRYLKAMLSLLHPDRGLIVRADGLGEDAFKRHSMYETRRSYLRETKCRYVHYSFKYFHSEMRCGRLTKDTVSKYRKKIGGKVRCLDHILVLDLLIPGLGDLSGSGDLMQWNVLASERNDLFKKNDDKRLWEISREMLCAAEDLRLEDGDIQEV